MNNCYLCKQVFSKENESVEHIIPNSIGGRLKSKKLLCKKCNSKLGTEYDSEVSKMFNASMIISGVKKDNNKNLSKEKFYDRNFNNMPFEFERNKTGIKINFNQIIRNKDSISVSGNKKFVEEKKKEISKKIQYEIETMLNKELENKENDSRELNEVGETIEELMINMIITNIL